MTAMEQNYFDAKFEGIEKLMVSHVDNINAHIGAVSKNVKNVADDLDKHKEKTDVHGLGEGRRLTDSLAKWGAVALSAVAIILGIRKGH